VKKKSGSDPNPGVPMTKYRREKPQKKCAETKTESVPGLVKTYF